MTKAKRDPDHDVQYWMGLPMRWNAKKMFANVWNKADERIFPPKQFGMGWDLNVHALVRKTGMLK